MNPFLARAAEAGIGAVGGGAVGALTAGEGNRGKGALMGAGLGAGTSLVASKVRRALIQHAIGREAANNHPMIQDLVKHHAKKALSTKLYGGNAESAMDNTASSIDRFLDNKLKISFSAFQDELEKISAYYLANDMSPEELNTLLGKPTVPTKPLAKKKLAAFGGFADPNPKGFASPPKSNPAQDMNAQAQAQKAQVQVQMASQQQQPQKTAEAEKVPDNNMTRPRVKQFLKNLAIIAPASAIGVGLGHLAGNALKGTQIGNFMQRSAGGTIPQAIGAVALTSGAMAIKSIIDNMSDKKIRDADKGKMGVR
jgi:hypothetical protein